MDSSLKDENSSIPTDPESSEESENLNAIEAPPDLATDAVEDTESQLPQCDTEEIVIKQEDKFDIENSESTSIEDNVETEKPENENLPIETVESANLTESENINNGLIENLGYNSSKGRKRKASETHSEEDKNDDNDQEKRPKNDTDTSLLTEIKGKYFSIDEN